MIKKILESVKQLDVQTNEIYYEVDILDCSDLLSTFVEIEVINSDEFLKIKESLTRIGIANITKKELYNTCLLLHKRGHYYITHFKEMFAMDAKQVEITEDDYIRRNHICNLLESWNLIKIKNRDTMYSVVENVPISVYVLPYSQKKDWKLIQKYAIGQIKESNNNGNK